MQLAAVAFSQLRERRLISGRRGSDNGLVLGIALCCLCPLHELLTSSAPWHRPCNQEKRPPVERAARRPGSTFGAFLDECPVRTGESPPPMPPPAPLMPAFL